MVKAKKSPIQVKSKKGKAKRKYMPPPVETRIVFEENHKTTSQTHIGLSVLFQEKPVDQYFFSNQWSEFDRQEVLVCKNLLNKVLHPQL